jgi:hypothetical protein
MKSWKIGAVSGLIAGIIAGIVASIFNILTINFGFNDWVPNLIVSHLLISSIWGIIFGIIYSKTYSLIPSRGIYKGIVFGLFVFLITNFRDVTYLLQSGLILISIGWMIIGFFQAIIYGSILSIIYQNLGSKYGISKKIPKIKAYKVSSGIYLGAIAGLIGGMAASLSRVAGVAIGLFPMVEIPTVSNIFVILIGAHLIPNLIWGIILGAIYTKVYNVIPGMGLIKGIFYGLIFFLVASFRTSVYHLMWGLSSDAWAWCYIGFFQALYFGILIGILYRKPPK